MLVGGGNAFDAVDVKPRIDCKLSQIPALDVSPQAGLAPLQVQPTSNSPTHYASAPCACSPTPIRRPSKGSGSAAATSPR